jgi:hypothetical protein
MYPSIKNYVEELTKEYNSISENRKEILERIKKTQ